MSSVVKYASISIALLSVFQVTNSIAADAKNMNIKLATTTSTYHSGLLDYLLPKFEKESGYHVDVLAAGTGKSLKMGENGDVDLVMTHAPKAEAYFVEQGFGVLPRKLMYNDFIVVGPKSDPAAIFGTKDVISAYKAIATSNSTFISRGDDSGTNKKEKILWAQTKIEPNFGGYKAIGQGMGPTLNMANELQAYTMTDRGTWLAYQTKLDLKVAVEGDKKLFNPYQVILVNPSRYPTINYDGAKALSDWLVTPKAQQYINDFKLAGQQLFVASAE